MKKKIISVTSDIIVNSGFKKFIIDDVAKQLGISKKTIYKHFTSKEEIIHEVVNVNLEADKENTLKAIEKEDTWIGKLRAAILFHHMNKIPIHLLSEPKYCFPEEWARINNLREFKKGLIRNLILEGIRDQAIKPDISCEIVEIMLDNTVPAIFNYEFLANNKYNVNQAIDEVVKIIFYGILNGSLQKNIPSSVKAQWTRR